MRLTIAPSNDYVLIVDYPGVKVRLVGATYSKAALLWQRADPLPGPHPYLSSLALAASALNASQMEQDKLFLMIPST